MRPISRSITTSLLYDLSRGKSILLLGPRQTGKTTLLKSLRIDAYYTFSDPAFRRVVEKDIVYFKNLCISLKKSLDKIPLIVIDEVQKVPAVMDLLQYCIDEKIAQFIITGSSARKLKNPDSINLLPGRVLVYYLDPFSINELAIENTHTLIERLVFGSLPEVALTSSVDDKQRLLESYASIYLEEEVRAEALVRNIGHFSQFLQLAAIESGNTLNLSKISQDIGVAHTTIANFYQILQDCLIVFKIEPFLKNASRNLLKSPKYLFFDLGIRQVCAHDTLVPSLEKQGLLFEHFVGLEIIRIKHILTNSLQLQYWRSYDGPEVDWIIKLADSIVPIEVKLTNTPSIKDAKHLILFLKEYPQTKKGYIVCLCDFEIEITSEITAISWKHIPNLIASLVRTV